MVDVDRAAQEHISKRCMHVSKHGGILRAASLDSGSALRTCGADDGGGKRSDGTGTGMAFRHLTLLLVYMLLLMLVLVLVRMLVRMLVLAAAWGET